MFETKKDLDESLSSILKLKEDLDNSFSEYEKVRNYSNDVLLKTERRLNNEIELELDKLTENIKSYINGELSSSILVGNIEKYTNCKNVYNIFLEEKVEKQTIHDEAYDTYKNYKALYQKSIEEYIIDLNKSSLL